MAQARLARGARIVGEARDELMAELTRRYAAGESIRSIATDLGRSYGFVQGLLKEAGVSLRTRGGPTRGAEAVAVRMATLEAVEAVRAEYAGTCQPASTAKAPGKELPAKKLSAKKLPAEKAVQAAPMVPVVEDPTPSDDVVVPVVAPEKHAAKKAKKVGKVAAKGAGVGTSKVKDSKSSDGKKSAKAKGGKKSAKGKDGKKAAKGKKK